MSGSVIVEAGHTKNFECQVVGNPLPTIKWFKDEVDITENPRYNIRYHKNGVISLVINNITTRDQGCYKCKAENSEGAAYTTSYLLVKAPSREKSLSSDREITKVIRRTSESSASGSESSTDQLLCNYEETTQVFEESKISKKKKIREVVEVVESTSMYEEIITVDSEGREVRTVREVVTSGKDEGQKQIRRESKEEISAEIKKREYEEEKIKQKERDEAEEKKRQEEKANEEKQRLEAEEKLKRMEEERLRKEEEERMKIKKERLRKEEEARAAEEQLREEDRQRENEERLKREEEEKMRIEDGMKRKEIEEQLREEEERQKKLTEEESKILKTETETHKEEVCEEEIKIEISKVEESVLTAVKKETMENSVDAEDVERPKPEVAITVDSVMAPVIDVKPEPVSIRVGEIILLKCKISGTPDPDVEWFKEGKLVKQKKSGRVTISPSATEGLYSLQITEAKKNDSGKYTVTATNSEGKIFHEVEVQVTKSKAEKGSKDEVPPEFTMKPVNVTVTEFDPVKISCSVSGKPAPTITWFKEGKPLKSEFNVKIYEEDGNAFLEILKASLLDAGEYTCTANNTAGGTFSTVFITVEALTEVESSASTDLDKEVMKRLTPRIAEEMERISDHEAEKDMLFKEYVMKEDFTDELMKVDLSKNDIVEVMDMKKSDEWLVRKQVQKDQVCYVPVSVLLGRDALDGAVDDDLVQVCEQVEQLAASPETGTLSLDGLQSPPKGSHSPSPDRRHGKLSRSPSKRVGSTDKEDASSEDDEFSSKLEALPVYVSIADYSPPDGAADDLRLKEGQFVDVLDMNNPDNWLVRTKPTKSHPAKVGWVPPCYLEKKDGGGHVDRRTTREVFREDIIQITNKEQEALVKRRYALTELLETERDYVKDLRHIMDTYVPAFERENAPDALKSKRDLVFGYLEEIYDFHNGHFLSELMNCTNEPSSVGNVFMKWKDKFDLYIPQYEHERETEQILNTEDSKQYLKAYGEEIGEETINLLPEYLKKPMLRINKYIQLLKDFVRYSSRAGENCSELEAAIKMLMNIPRHAADLLSLCHIEGHTGNLADSGPILRGDDFLVWDTEPVGRAKERHLLLFQDKLLLAKPKKQDSNLEEMDYVLKSVIDLHNVQINEEDLDDERMFELWYVDPTCEKLVLQASTPYAKQAWVKDIRDALRKLGIEETDLSAEDRLTRKIAKTKTPSPKKKPAPDPPVPEEIRKALLEETDGEPGVTTDDYMTMDSYESDVSSVYHTAPEFEDGTSRPGFKRRLSKVVVTEGGTAMFTCVGGGQPKPDITWLKDNQPIQVSDKFKFLKDGDTDVLEIHEVTKVDCGIYAAVATNKNGTVSCVAELDLGEDMYKLEEAAEETASEPQQKAPSVVSAFSDVKTFEGEVATFECKISAQPDPEITWYKDSKKIVSDGTHFNFLFPDDEAYSLVISDLQATDSGSVSCHASNKLGEVTLKAKLHVQDSPVTFTYPLKDQIVLDGTDAIFECQISKPKSEIYVAWHRNGKRITHSEKFDIVCDGTVQKLTVHNVCAEDRGEFSVRIGEQQSSGKLKVKETPLIFVKKIKEQTAVENSELTFECEISKQNEEVCWTRNSKKINPSDKYEIMMDGKTHKLIIHNVALEDSGRFGAEVGLDGCSARLNVEEAPLDFKVKFENQELKEEEDLTLSCEVNKTGSRVTWYKNGERIWPDGRIEIKAHGVEHCLLIPGVKLSDKGEFSCRVGDQVCKAVVLVKEGSPKFKNKLSAPVAMEFDDVVLKCQLTKPNAVVSWSRNGEELSSSEKYELVMAGTEHSLIIHGVSMEDAAEYTVKSGEHSSTTKLKVDEAPVTFSSKLQDKTIVEGEDACLTCETNKPSSDVAWYRYGKKIYPDDRTETQSDGTKHSLLIHKASFEDSARYTARVNGESTAAKLTVDEAPMSFTVKLEDKTIAPNDSLVLSCEVNKSYARLTWYKDGVKLTYNPHYDIRSQGKQFTLSVDQVKEEDSGEYSVKTEDGTTCSAKVSVQTEPVEEESSEVESGGEEITEKEETEESAELKEEVLSDKSEEPDQISADKSEEPDQISADKSEEPDQISVGKTDEALEEVAVEEKEAKQSVAAEEERDELTAAEKTEDVIPDKSDVNIATEISEEKIAENDETVSESEDEVDPAELKITAPPVCFTSELTDQIAETEESITLSCELSESSAKVIWYKDGEQITDSDKYSFTVAEKQHSLVIHVADVEDGGKYVARTEDGEASTATLTVIEPALHFAKEISNQTIMEGGIATFTCEINKAHSNVKWCKDEEEIKPSEKYALVEKDKQYSLVINDVSVEDEGMYVAKIGDVMCSAALTVEEPKQCFAKEITDQSVLEGDVATFSCEVNRSNSNVVWCKDGEEIKLSEKYTLVEKDKQFSLVINDVTVEDEGKYVAKIGEDVMTSAVLSVEEKPVRFVAELEDKIVFEKDSVTLTCRLSKANAKITWYKNKKKISPNEKYKMTADDSEHALCISDLSTDDSAKYTVKAGEVSCDANVTVKEAPLGFSLSLDDVNLKEDEDLTLKCEVNKAGSRVTWCKDGLQIWPDGRVEMKAYGQSHSLFIPGVKMAEAGEYSCRVADQMCKAMVSVQEGSPKFKGKLHAYPAMEFEDTVMKCELSKTNAAVVWLKDGEEITASDKYEMDAVGRAHSLTIHNVTPEDAVEYTVKAGDNTSSVTLKVKEAPISFPSKPKDQTVYEGEDACLTCETNKPSSDVAWYRYGKKIYPDDRTETQSDGTKHSLLIHKASFEDSARYTARVGDESVALKLTVDEAPVSFTTALEDQTVAPNNNLTLTYEVSKPYARVTWYKDGIRLMYDPRFEIRSRGKVHTLTFEKVKESDSGEYRVKSENDATCAASILVTEPSASFTKNLEKQSAVEEETATFVCEVSKPGEKVTWYKDGNEILADDKYEMSTDGREERLTVHNVELQDSGEFTVKLPDDVCSSAQLAVLEAPVRFTVGLHDQTAQEGDRANLTCTVNKPNVKVSWYKDGVEIFPCDKFMVTASGLEQSLCINNLYVKDAAKYTVKYGDTTCDARLTVEELPVTFDMELSSQKVVEGEDVTFRCKTNKPDVKVSWSRNGENITSNDTYEIGQDGTEFSLVIHSVSLEQSAEYTVKTRDRSSSAKLTVQEKPVSFTTGLSDTTITEDQDVTLSCEVNKPGSKVSWWKNDKEIISDDKYKISNEEYKHILTIHNVSLDEAAEYTVKSGDAVSAATLTVTEAPVIFTGKLEDQTVTEKETVTFTCVLSKASGKVTWYKYANQIKPSERHQITEDGCVRRLTVSSLSLTDAGEYSVKVEDSSSTAKLIVNEAPVTFTMQLKDQDVLENSDVTLTCEVSKPDVKVIWLRDGKKIMTGDKDKFEVKSEELQHSLVIHNLALDDTAEYSVKVANEKSSAKITVQEAPLAFTQTLTDQDVVEDDDMTLICEISKPNVKVVWLKDGEEINADEKDKYEYKVENLQHSLTIHKLALQDSAKYTVKMDCGESSANINVKEKPVKFTVPLKDSSVEENSHAIFTCEISKPNVKVTWLRNGKVIEESDKFVIAEEGVVRTLTIKQVALAETGEYSVTTADETTSAKLHVEEAPVTFTLTLVDQSAHEHDDVCFTCELSHSEVKINWYKNGKKIKSDNVKYKIKSKGKKRMLTLFDVSMGDSGEYSVKLNGRGRTSATLSVKVPDKASEIEEEQIEPEVTEPEVTEPEQQAPGTRTEEVAEKQIESEHAQLQDQAPDEAAVAQDETAEPDVTKSAQAAKEAVEVEEDEIEAEVTKPDQQEDEIEAEVTKPDQQEDEIEAEVTKPDQQEDEIEAEVTKSDQQEDEIEAEVTKPDQQAPDEAAVPQEETAEPDVTESAQEKPKEIEEDIIVPEPKEEEEKAKKEKKKEKKKKKKEVDGMKNEVEEAVITPDIEDQEQEWLNGIQSNISKDAFAKKEKKKKKKKGSEEVKKVDGEEPVTEAQESGKDEKKEKKKEKEGKEEKKEKKKKVEEEQEKETEGIAPEILSVMKDVSVVEGSVAKFSCKVKGAAEPDILWLRDGQDLPSNKKYKVKFDGGKCSLSVKGVETSDSGVFTCRISSSFGTAETSADLRVEEDTSKITEAVIPKFGKSINDVNAKLGDEVKFECQISGEASISWLYQDHIIESSENVEIGQVADSYWLLLRKCELTDQGVYMCQAVNSAGQASCKAELIVTQPEKPQPQVDEDLSSAYTPIFTKRIEDTEVSEDGSVQFECRIVGEPQPDVQWFKDGVLIDIGDKFSTEQTDGTFRLLINTAGLDDGGCYKCAVSNKAGSASCEAQLIVEPAKKEETPVQKEVEKKDALKQLPPQMPLEKPEITESGSDFLYMKWQPASYPSYATAPYLPFSYIVEKRELPRHDWVQVASGITDTSYRIRDFNTERDNCFRVRAENEYGAGEPSLSLTRYTQVPKEEKEEQDDFKTKMPPRLLREKPLITDITHNSFTLSWKPAEFPAYAKWTPIMYSIEMKDPYTHGWKTHRKDLQDSTFKFSNFPVNRDYSFRIRAENEYGRSEPSYTVSLTQEFVEDKGLKRKDSSAEKPKVPPRTPFDKPRLTEQTDGSLLLSWPPSTIPDYAQQLAITYIVERKEHPGQAWTRIAVDLTETQYKITGLNTEKDYSFRIRSQNEAGITDPSLPVSYLKKIDWSKKIEEEIEKRRVRRSSRERDLKPREVPEYMRILPEFVAADSSIQYAVEHKMAKIVCHIKCYPEPTIMFFFKGDKIELGDRYNSYLSSSGELRLEFDEMSKSDVGEYRVYIENQYGSASSTIQLEIADPPCFIEPLKDVIIYLRGSGMLECRVDGNPYPNIIFKRDWRTLTDTHRVKIRRDDSDHWTLQVNNAIYQDEAMYECVAENIAGKIHCSANVKVIERTQFLSDVQFNSLMIEDHFHVLEEIGRGSSGVVRRVINKMAGSEFAAKFLRVNDEAQKEDLRLELETMKLLCHKNILQIETGYDATKQLVIVSEVLTGGPLFEQLVYQDNLTESEGAFYIRQLIEAVEFMHSKHVVHLDLKPENLLLTRPSADEIKLIDFGFARKFTSYQRHKVPVLYGTPEFTAPEVVKDGEATIAADMWSVGVICYVLLSGMSPFCAESDRDTLLKVKEAKWGFDEDAFSQISAEAKDFISGLLTEDPSKRRSAAQCREHPWLEQADRRGLGSKISIDKLKEYNMRRKMQIKHRQVRRTVNQVTLTTMLQEVPAIEVPEEEPQETMSEADRLRRASSVSSYTSSDVGSESDLGAAFEDEDTWYQWSSFYQQGPETYLLPASDVGMSLRMRQYRQIRGDKHETVPFDIEDDEHIEDRLFRMRTVKDRRDLKALDREMLETPLRAMPVTRRVIKQLQMIETEAGLSKKGISEAGLPPIFKEKLRDKAYNVGDSVTISCQVIARPAPTVTWYRNEQPLCNGGRIRTTESPEDGRYTLTVLSTKPHDFGIYKVVVRNKHGTAKSRARLLFGDHPGRPGRPHVTKVAATEVFLIWDEPEHDGNSPILSYRIDLRKKGEDQWNTAIYTIDECALVKKLEPDTIYRFRVTAVNVFGIGPYSWGSVECRTKLKGSPKLDIDYETKKLVLRSRQALEQGHLEASPTSSRRSSIADEDADDLVVKKKIAEDEREIHLQEISPETFFEFGSIIWRGRFSVVRNCSIKATKRCFVAKISPYDSDNGEESLREYEILKRVNHQHIVCLREAFLIDRFVVLIQEKLSGENIIRALSFKNKYNEQMVSQVVIQILDAIQFLHHRGIVYLNLQPDNVVTVSQRRYDIKLIDFGRACKVTTEEGGFVKMEGTPEFMAPEKICKEKVGVAADIWGVGVMTFIMLSGVSPFRGEDRDDTFSRIRNVQYDTTNLYFNCSRHSLRFILQMLRRDPRARMTLDECLDHRWLHLKESAVKRRKATVFMTDRLRQFAEVYQTCRRVGVGASEDLVKAFGGSSQTEEDEFRLSDKE